MQSRRHRAWSRWPRTAHRQRKRRTLHGKHVLLRGLGSHGRVGQPSERWRDGQRSGAFRSGSLRTGTLLPLLPRAVQHHLVRDEGQMPPWVLRSARRQYGLQTQTFVAANYAGPVGGKYHHSVAETVSAVASNMEYGVIGDELDVRHPFLHRPLVEFALRLPPELCARPQARKWILREAMRGILPEAVRTRIGKGTPIELYASSLTTHRGLLEPLVGQPILADLGLIDAAKLRTAFYSAPQQPHRREDPHGAVQSTLAIEAWLQIRSGRWPHRGGLSSSNGNAGQTPLCLRGT